MCSQISLKIFPVNSGTTDVLQNYQQEAPTEEICVQNLWTIITGRDALTQKNSTSKQKKTAFANSVEDKMNGGTDV